MFFRDLSVDVARTAELPAGQDRSDFNQAAYHVQEIFLSFIPGKCELDGMAKTNLYLGPRGDESQYQQLINVNKYYFEQFDFTRFFAANERDREEIVLDAIEKSLADIAGRFRVDPAPFRQAAESTRACNFRRKYMVKKLCRSTKSRRLRLNVFREIMLGGERWGIEFTGKHGDVLGTRWIAESTNFLAAAYDYKKSLWKGDHFVILDFLGRQKYRLNVGPIERKLLKSEKSR